MEQLSIATPGWMYYVASSIMSNWRDAVAQHLGTPIATDIEPAFAVVARERWWTQRARSKKRWRSLSSPTWTHRVAHHTTTRMRARRMLGLGLRRRRHRQHTLGHLPTQVVSPSRIPSCVREPIVQLLRR